MSTQYSSIISGEFVRIYGSEGVQYFPQVVLNGKTAEELYTGLDVYNKGYVKGSGIQIGRDEWKFFEGEDADHNAEVFLRRFLAQGDGELADLRRTTRHPLLEEEVDLYD